MYPYSLAAPAVALLASVVTPAIGQYNPTCAFFVQYTGGSLALQRVDPLLSPGVASNHLHSITGADGFKANMNFQDTQGATCTTAAVSQDKSNYWMPALFFHNNGQFTRVPEAYNRKIYYKYGNSKCAYDDRSEFPQNFRMMTGSATQRVENDTMMGSAGSQMQWSCHDGSSKPPTATGFPTGFQSCNDKNVPGLAASMRFPSCWNGQDFDQNNPLAHMAFPTNADGIAGCPAPHNVKRFPEIFIEYYLDTKQFDNINKNYNDPNNPPWVLADGDPTGYSFHMDFINGWEPGVLQAAMKTCAISDGGSDVGVGLGSSQCFGSGFNPPAKQNACRLASIVTPSENVGVTGSAALGENGGTLNALPGCNPIQTTQPATIHDPSTCGAATAVQGGSPPAGGSSGSSNSNAPVAPVLSAAGSSSITSTSAKASSAAKSSVPAKENIATPVTPIAEASSPAASPGSSSSTPSGSAAKSITVQNSTSSDTWTYQGCYTDLTVDRNTRTLSAGGSGSASSDCASSCYSQGYTIAGTEDGFQCYCGNSLVSSTKASDSDCNMPCSADKSQTCGGSSRLSIFAKSGTSLTSRSAHARRHVARRVDF